MSLGKADHDECMNNTISETLTNRLRQALTTLNTRGWTRYAYNDGSNTALPVCLHGAVRVCAPRNGDEYLVSAVLRLRGHTERWNDSSSRKKSEVSDLLATFEINEEILAERFGSLWREVVVLARAVSGLTENQEQDVAAAYDKRDIKAHGLARAALLDAIWQSPRDFNDIAHSTITAIDSLLGFERAIEDASSALIMYDLIGTAGYTQEHHDTLMAPWLSAKSKW